MILKYSSQLFVGLIKNKTREVYSYTMNALHNNPWLSWTWILAVIARIQIGNQAGILEIIEGICQSNFSTIDEVWKMRYSAFRLIISSLFKENGYSRG